MTAHSEKSARAGDFVQRLQNPETRADRCADHGEFASLKFPFGGTWSGCPACADAREAAEREAEQKARREQAFARQLAAAMIPARYALKTLENFETAQPAQLAALHKIRGYAARIPAIFDSGESLILAGPPGTGKTHAAAALVRHAAEQGFTARYATLYGLCGEIKATYNRDAAENESDVLKRFAGYQFLVIDEVGAQIGTDAERQMIFQVINARYESMRPTVIATNLDVESMRRVLGDRTIDRLREGGGRMIAMNWDSYRGAKQ